MLVLYVGRMWPKTWNTAVDVRSEVGSREDCIRHERPEGELGERMEGGKRLSSI